MWLSFFYQGIAQPLQEFRAVWVATVDNIDWPTKGNYDSEKQQQEFRNLLDRHQRNGINAVIAQVRPATDAFYPSPYEPWSEWLTGRQGAPPRPYYDPLQFMIEETHKRGMEFHAWCNPYRAVFKLGKSFIASTHITRLHPEWFLDYGDKKYFDPGHPEAQQFVVNVIRDIVSRYAVDAIHFDDYFYPYRLPGKEFPDSRSYQKFSNGMRLDDWRRSNVDSIILKLGRAIKAENKFCRFGISPFGVWRNNDKDSAGSATQAGQTNYDDLYADILLWLKNDWIDYVAPQLYWEFGHPRAPYEVLLDWWNRNTFGKHCYIGLGVYRAGSNPAWKDKTLLPRQVDALRKATNIQGMVFFSSKSFESNPNGWNDSLQQRLFNEPAIVPPMSWISTTKPEKPLVTLPVKYAPEQPVQLRITTGGAPSAIKQFLVYEWPAAELQAPQPGLPKIRILPALDGTVQLTLPAAAANRVWAISAVDYQNNESEWSRFGPIQVSGSPGNKK